MAPLFTGLKLGFGRAEDAIAIPISPISATGGNQTPANGLAPGNGYKYHTFSSPGTFTVSSGNDTIEILAVGGGGGGVTLGGGGGAGGLVYAPSYPVLSGVSFTIVVGGGGAAGPEGPRVSGQGTPTTLTGPVTITADGGGRATMQGAGSPGGSGGGGALPGGSPFGTATQPTANPGIVGLLQYGNPGGASAAGPGPYTEGGGGGGAGATGGAYPSPRDGGIGRQYPQFTGPLIGVPTLNPLSGYFAGGGGGGDRTSAAQNTSGGAGGGGNGGGSPTAGATNSGGGGGGGRYPGGSGSAGGSGIVIIRYVT
jgi:hypothetical protein